MSTAFERRLMPFKIRVATVAAILSCAAASLGATSPGLAREVEADVRSVVNAAPAVAVPTPPSPILPASLTPESTDLDAEPPIGAAAAPVDTNFASLSDAVDAHTLGTGQLDDETRCLAIGVYFEAKGEPLSGQLAVANVIVNRSESGRFPSSLCGVLKQRSQFSFVRGGRLPDVPEGRAAWKTAVAVAKIAVADAWKNPAPDALFFHARHVSPRWNKARVASLGNHIFYR